ncbi:hypothetical protein MVEN_01786500 [Mycena venus]|uniref:Uncharacterized protein n=1 Tax=Mycena venus TaxID=2733690 RepID=A0A8H7CLD3_9AGAR|nr:hypothetical protein MVEN_01786500 [Mycena venus]
MPNIPEEPVYAVVSALPTKALVTILCAAVIAVIIHYMSPLRLIGILIAAINKAEETYIEAHGAGLLLNKTEMLYILQLRHRVSAMIEKTLRNSLSWRAALRDFLCGRTFILLRCIREVQIFETRIKFR